MTDHDHASMGHKSDQSLDRLIFFSDGVFAIAITLLAIELHPPHDWDGTFSMLIREELNMLLAFLLSFAVVGVFWNSHRRVFLSMTRFDGGVFTLNLILLALIALMPFATVLQSGTPDGFMIYGALVGVAGLFQGLTYAYAAFVAKIMYPNRPWPLRLSAFLMLTLMPPLSCWLPLLFFSHASPVLVVADAVALASVIAFQIFVARRFTSSPVLRVRLSTP